MQSNPQGFARHLLRSLRTVLVGPQLFAFVPAMMLLGYWFGGEVALILFAVGMPVVVLLVSSILPRAGSQGPPGVLGLGDPLTGLPLRDTAVAQLDRDFADQTHGGGSSLALATEIDGFADFHRDHGDGAADQVLRVVAGRIQAGLRAGDTLVRIGDARFAVALAPTHRANLESSIQLAARLQGAISDPITIGGLRVHMTASVGFCLPRRATERTGEACLAAAEQALEEAQTNGHGAIRAFTTQPRRQQLSKNGLVGDVEAALEGGQILPWFQPQLSTDTGAVSGVEALARWTHPTHGVIMPGAFLSTISSVGQTARLGEVILFHSLSALRTWDLEDIHVPHVGVNFSNDDLADPKLIEKIAWELDRFQLTPDRLAVEILETVVSEVASDVISQNIAKLADLGCKIDLDDFGTGHASIASVRRFCVNRIKIDRSFVAKIDTDRDQHKMLTAILEMAGRLELETLAEGVETMGEHALLAQLGCHHVQGYYIAKAMPLDEATDWLRRQAETQTAFPALSRKNGR